MDAKHRDRIAFVRLCSGKFRRGMKLKHVRSGKMLTAHNPLLFLAQDRELAEEAWAGDIIGIPNHGNLRIGDALTEGEEMSFIGIPSFAPELMRKVRPEVLKAKHLGRASFRSQKKVPPAFLRSWIQIGLSVSSVYCNSMSSQIAFGLNTTYRFVSKQLPCIPRILARVR